MADVGTHLVDLAQWTLFPDTAIDYRNDIGMLSASRWPTKISAGQFKQVTGQAGPGMDYYCNTRVSYTLRGVHVKFDVLWNWEAAVAGGGDTHFAVYRGTKSRVEVRQGKEENWRPELYVVTKDPTAVKRKVAALTAKYPGIATEQRGADWLITIPDSYRVGHEAHFAQVTNQFFTYLKHPETMPAWENPNMLAKYWVTTQGTALSHGAAA